MAENTEIHGKNTENETIYTEIKVHRLEALVDDHARDGASSFVVVRPCIATIWGGGGGGGGGVLQ